MRVTLDMSPQLDVLIVNLIANHLTLNNSDIKILELLSCPKYLILCIQATRCSLKSQTVEKEIR